MKKLTAIALIFAMLFAFAACKEVKSGETETSSEAAETTESVTKETEKETEAAETAAAKKYLAATDEDFETLTHNVLGIMMNIPDHYPVFGECDDEEFKELVKNSTSEDYKNAYYYNSKSDNALGDAMYIIWNGRMGSGGGLEWDKDYEIFYAGSNSEGEVHRDFDSDPLYKFDDAPGYIKFNADQLDSVLENVFCVEPDRTKTSEDLGVTSYEEGYGFYYHDGYYYFWYDEGGGGDYSPEIVDYTEQPDGSYIIKLSNYSEDYIADMNIDETGEDYIYTIYEVSAGLKEVDGKRIWSFSYLKPAEYVIYEK